MITIKIQVQVIELAQGIKNRIIKFIQTGSDGHTKLSARKVGGRKTGKSGRIQSKNAQKQISS